MPTSATLTGPTSGMGGVASTDFTVTLDSAAGAGGVTVTIASSVIGDTFTPSTLVISSISSSGTFTLTPGTIGARNVSITTSPTLTIIGSPITYTATGNCPDDTGGVNRTQSWVRTSATCPPTVIMTFTTTPSTQDAKDLYCTTGSVSLTITE